MKIIRKVKLEVAEKLAGWFIGRVVVSLETGRYGPNLQTLYVRTKGKKAAIGLLVFLILQALAEFQPPQLDQLNFVARLGTGGLMAFGILDKAFRKEPIVPKWFLEALASVTAWIGWFEGFAGSILHLLPLFFPDQVELEHWALRWALVHDAVAVACGFVNRVARAQAAPSIPVLIAQGKIDDRRTVPRKKNGPSSYPGVDALPRP